MMAKAMPTRMGSGGKLEPMQVGGLANYCRGQSAGDLTRGASVEIAGDAQVNVKTEESQRDDEDWRGESEFFVRCE
jgi:hypothetical protein